MARLPDVPDFGAVDDDDNNNDFVGNNDANALLETGKGSGHSEDAVDVNVPEAAAAGGAAALTCEDEGGSVDMPYDTMPPIDYRKTLSPHDTTAASSTTSARSTTAAAGEPEAKRAKREPVPSDDVPKELVFAVTRVSGCSVATAARLLHATHGDTDAAAAMHFNELAPAVTRVAGCSVATAVRLLRATHGDTDAAAAMHFDTLDVDYTPWNQNTGLLVDEVAPKSVAESVFAEDLFEDLFEDLTDFNAASAASG